MTLIMDPAKVASVLIASGGWETIVVGSLTIDRLELVPPVNISEAEDYGFSCVSNKGRITGRISSLLAVSEAPR